VEVEENMEVLWEKRKEEKRAKLTFKLVYE